MGHVFKKIDISKNNYKLIRESGSGMQSEITGSENLSHVADKNALIQMGWHYNLL